MASLVAATESVIINSHWMQEIMAGPEETPWFPEYYIGWTGIGNCDQETSNIKAFLATYSGSLFGLIDIIPKL